MSSFLGEVFFVQLSYYSPHTSILSYQDADHQNFHLLTDTVMFICNPILVGGVMVLYKCFLFNLVYIYL